MTRTNTSDSQSSNCSASPSRRQSIDSSTSACSATAVDPEKQLLATSALNAKPKLQNTARELVCARNWLIGGLNNLKGLLETNQMEPELENKALTHRLLRNCYIHMPGLAHPHRNTTGNSNWPCPLESLLCLLTSVHTAHTDSVLK